MKRTIVLLAAMVALVVVYAGAAWATSVSEVEPNDSIAEAQNIDPYFSLDSDPNITDSTTVPHATVDGTGNGTFDYYSFTVPQAGVTGVFDIDGAYPSFDSHLRLYNASGELVAQNDDAPPDAGSAASPCSVQPGTCDSYLEYTFPSAGTYYIEVGWCRSTLGVCAISPVSAGASYTLNVSVPPNPPPDTTAPTTTIALDPATPNGQNGWYTSDVHLTVSADDGTGSGVEETRCVLDPDNEPTSFDALPTDPCPYLGSGADVGADGEHVLYAASIDEAGNEETPVVSKQFKIDSTDPSTTCSVTPSTLRLPANSHKLVTVTASVQVTDSGSGPDSFKLLSATSNQADSGLGPDDVPNDIQGWTTGTADTSGQVRAERYGGSREYTLTYQGYDLAGNTSNCAAKVTVPRGS